MLPRLLSIILLILTFIAINRPVISYAEYYPSTLTSTSLENGFLNIYLKEFEYDADNIGEPSSGVIRVAIEISDDTFHVARFLNSLPEGDGADEMLHRVDWYFHQGSFYYLIDTDYGHFIVRQQSKNDDVNVIPQYTIARITSDIFRKPLNFIKENHERANLPSVEAVNDHLKKAADPSEALESIESLHEKVVNGGGVVGEIQGDSFVSPVGSFSYSLPFHLPKDKRGNAPLLSAVVTNSSIPSIIGKGATLSGLPKISRCLKSVDERNIKELPSLAVDSSNKLGIANMDLCLSGSRLRLVSGEVGLIGSTYHLWNDHRVTVEMYGNDDGTTYFKVFRPDGSEEVYGPSGTKLIVGDTQSFSGGQFNQLGQELLYYEWNIHSIKNHLGDLYEYIWHPFSYYESRPQEGQLLVDLLLTIRYGGNVYHVDFSYKNRSLDESETKNRFNLSVLGSTEEIPFISQVSISSSVESSKRIYSLEYEESGYLKAIQTCSTVSGCLKPTYIARDQAKSGTIDLPTIQDDLSVRKYVDVNYDGIVDVLEAKNGNIYIIDKGNETAILDSPLMQGYSIKNFDFVDTNNDGDLELLVHQYRYVLGCGTTTAPGDSSGGGATTTPGNSGGGGAICGVGSGVANEGYHPEVGYGDTRVESLYRLFSYSPSETIDHTFLYDTVEIKVNLQSQPFEITVNGLRTYMLADLDGDNNPELFLPESSTYDIYKLDERISYEGGIYNRHIYSLNGNIRGISFLDLNGDGYKTIVGYTDNSSNIFIEKYRSFTTPPGFMKSRPGFTIYMEDSGREGLLDDLNNDRIADVVSYDGVYFSKENFDGYHTEKYGDNYKSSEIGSEFKQRIKTNYHQKVVDFVEKYRTSDKYANYSALLKHVDYDGDGLKDVIYLNETGQLLISYLRKIPKQDDDVGSQNYNPFSYSEPVILEQNLTPFSLRSEVNESEQNRITTITNSLQAEIDPKIVELESLQSVVGTAWEDLQEEIAVNSEYDRMLTAVNDVLNNYDSDSIKQLLERTWHLSQVSRDKITDPNVPSDKIKFLRGLVPSNKATHGPGNIKIKYSAGKNSKYKEKRASNITVFVDLHGFSSVDARLTLPASGFYKISSYPLRLNPGKNYIEIPMTAIAKPEYLSNGWLHGALAGNPHVAGNYYLEIDKAFPSENASIIWGLHQNSGTVHNNYVTDRSLTAVSFREDTTFTAEVEEAYALYDNLSKVESSSYCSPDNISIDEYSALSAVEKETYFSKKLEGYIESCWSKLAIENTTRFSTRTNPDKEITYNYSNYCNVIGNNGNQGDLYCYMFRGTLTGVGGAIGSVVEYLMLTTISTGKIVRSSRLIEGLMYSLLEESAFDNYKTKIASEIVLSKERQDVLNERLGDLEDQYEALMVELEPLQALKKQLSSSPEIYSKYLHAHDFQLVNLNGYGDVSLTVEKSTGELLAIPMAGFKRVSSIQTGLSDPINVNYKKLGAAELKGNIAVGRIVVDSITTGQNKVSYSFSGGYLDQNSFFKGFGIVEQRDNTSPYWVQTNYDVTNPKRPLRIVSKKRFDDSRFDIHGSSQLVKEERYSYHDRIINGGLGDFEGIAAKGVNISFVAKVDEVVFENGIEQYSITTQSVPHGNFAYELAQQDRVLTWGNKNYKKSTNLYYVDGPAGEWHKLVSGRNTHITNFDGSTSTIEVENLYNGLGQLSQQRTKIDSELVSRKGFEYNSHHLLERETQYALDGNSVALHKSYSYSVDGLYVNEVTGILGNVEYRVPEGGYDYLNQGPTVYYDDLGNLTYYYYDGFSQITRVRNQVNDELQIFFYCSSDCQTDEKYYEIYKSLTGSTTLKYFSGNGKLLREGSLAADDKMRYISYTYDDSTRLNSYSLPYKAGEIPKEVTYTYDDANRRVTISKPDGTRIIEDSDVLSATTLDEKNRLTRKQFDPLGRVISATDLSGFTTTFRYDALDNVLEINSVNGITSHSYRAGRRISSITPETGLTEFQYDNFGRITITKYSDNSETATNYDDYGRIVSKLYGGPSNATTPQYYQYEYDKQYTGYLSSKQVNGNTVNYQYDEFGRLIDESITYSRGGQSFTRHTEFNSLGLVDRTSYNNSEYGNGFTLQYGYASNGEIDRIYDANSGKRLVEHSQFDSFGLSSETRLNEKAVVRSKLDTKTGRLEKKSFQLASNNTDLSYKLGYDHTGNVTSIQNNGEHYSASYDDVDRLTSTNLLGVSQNYTYKNNGNIDHKSNVGSYIYGGKSASCNIGVEVGPTAVTAIAGQENYYCYDQLGRVIKSHKYSIKYTSSGQASWIYNDKYFSFHEYSDTGSKVYEDLYERATEKHIKERYIPFSEYELTKSEDTYIERLYVNENLYLENSSLSTGQSVTVQARDFLGSPIQLEKDGYEYGQINYDAWGQSNYASDQTRLELMKSLVSSDGFTGHQTLGPFGLVDMGARLYDPEIGRFLQPDKVVQDPYDSQSYNRYTYVKNNPLSRIDPDGNTSYYFYYNDVKISIQQVSSGEEGNVYSLTYGSTQISGVITTMPNGVKIGDPLGQEHFNQQIEDALAGHLNNLTSAELNQFRESLNSLSIDGFSGTLPDRASGLTLTQLNDMMIPLGGIDISALSLPISDLTPNNPLSNALNSIELPNSTSVESLQSMHDRLSNNLFYALTIGDFVESGLQVASGNFSGAALNLGIGLAKVTGAGAIGVGAYKLWKRFGRQCFAAGTLVLTASGSQSIESLEAGDLVLSSPEQSVAEVQYQEVLEVIDSGVQPVIEIQYTIDNELHSIEVTKEHPLYVVNQGWTEAHNIRVGQLLHASNNRQGFVINIIDEGIEKQTYNLSINDTKTYYVDEGVLAHNECSFDFDKARRKAFDNAGMSDPSKVQFSKVDPNTGTVVEFKGPGGAKVGYDGPHDSPGPHHDTQHISWQGAGKRKAGGRQRGNIPYNGQRHPSRPDRKEQ